MTLSSLTVSAPKYRLFASLLIHLENKPLQDSHESPWLSNWDWPGISCLLWGFLTTTYEINQEGNTGGGGGGGGLIWPHQTSRCESTFRYCYHHLQPSLAVISGDFPTWLLQSGYFKDCSTSCLRVSSHLMYCVWNSLFKVWRVHSFSFLQKDLRLCLRGWVWGCKTQGCSVLFNPKESCTSEPHAPTWLLLIYCHSTHSFKRLQETIKVC